MTVLILRDAPSVRRASKHLRFEQVQERAERSPFHNWPIARSCEDPTLCVAFGEEARSPYTDRISFEIWRPGGEWIATESSLPDALRSSFGGWTPLKSSWGATGRIEYWPGVLGAVEIQFDGETYRARQSGPLSVRVARDGGSPLARARIIGALEPMGSLCDRELMLIAALDQAGVLERATIYRWM